jgi:hypothetical protein
MEAQAFLALDVLTEALRSLLTSSVDAHRIVDELRQRTVPVGVADEQRASRSSRNDIKIAQDAEFARTHIPHHKMSWIKRLL